MILVLPLCLFYIKNSVHLVPFSHKEYIKLDISTCYWSYHAFQKVLQVTTKPLLSHNDSGMSVSLIRERCLEEPSIVWARRTKWKDWMNVSVVKFSLLWWSAVAGLTSCAILSCNLWLTLQGPHMTWIHCSQAEWCKSQAMSYYTKCR